MTDNTLTPYDNIDWKTKFKTLAIDDFLNLLKDALLFCYKINNNKIDSNIIDKSNFLPSFKTVKKYISNKNPSIKDIYKLCNIEMDEKYIDRHIDKHKILYSEIKKTFEHSNCVLLSQEKEYKNLHSKVKYICNCGSESTIKVRKFMMGQRCQLCGINKNSNTRRTDFNYVLNLYKANNCILLSKKDDYINNSSKLEFICSCGCKNITSFTSFKRHKRCKKCSTQKGKDHYSWKGGISLISSHCRGLLGEWKKDSMKKCGYKCILTGGKFDVIHHLYSFDNILIEVIKNLKLNKIKQISGYSPEELNNIDMEVKKLHEKHGCGVCLNDKLHKLFHQLYGRGDNTHEQFTEFVNRLKIGEFNTFLKDNKLKIIL